jgi:Fic family protein
MDVVLGKDEVLPQLWAHYEKSSEFASGKTGGIPADFPLVIKHEKDGLKRIYGTFIQNLKSEKNASQALRDRSVSEWLFEWKGMHDLLFSSILKKERRGNWRKKEVRFGSPGEEELYGIPQFPQVPREMEQLASEIRSCIVVAPQSLEDKFILLARIHYQFIRIHPFADGNGRIARAITDQLAQFLELPPAMAGYPRHDSRRRKSYHNAISDCIYDPECRNLGLWIGSYVDKQLETLA